LIERNMKATSNWLERHAFLVLQAVLLIFAIPRVVTDHGWARVFWILLAVQTLIQIVAFGSFLPRRLRPRGLAAITAMLTLAIAPGILLCNAGVSPWLAFPAGVLVVVLAVFALVAIAVATQKTNPVYRTWAKRSQNG
jgi:hypothetical protein